MAIKPFKARVGKGSRAGSGVYGAGSTGIEEIVADFTDFCQHIEDMAPEIMYEALKPTFAKSQQLVPVDTGDLKDSGYLEIVGFGRRARVEMGYGKGGHPHYAPIVHEDTIARHAAPTQAKFLERPLNDDYFSLLNRVAAMTKKAGGL